MSNNLHSAKKAKDDEYYTKLTDIEKELKNYKSHFEGKVVFCNCDDPEWSNFYIFFKNKLHEYGIKKLISTHYTENNLYDAAYQLECVILENNNGEIKETKNMLKGNGDFRNEECIALLKESDIVCTNPPFSLFREYIAQLIEFNKKFIVIGNMTAVTYKEIFKLIKENKIWLGVSPRNMSFKTKNEEEKEVNAVWFTNIEHEKRNEDIYLKVKYSVKDYLFYENFNAIEVGQVDKIPVDYMGIMGVPITFLEKYNPDQFELIGLGISNSGLEVGVQPYKEEHRIYRKTVQKRGAVNGDLYLMKNGEVVVKFARILIRHKKEDNDN